MSRLIERRLDERGQWFGNGWDEIEGMGSCALRLVMLYGYVIETDMRFL